MAKKGIIDAKRLKLILPKENYKAPGLTALLLAVVLWLYPWHNAFGEPPPGAAGGVVFVVETSAALARTDPQGLTVHALKLAAALFMRDDALGLITFNEKAAAVAAKITPADQRAAIYKAIEEVGKSSSDNISVSGVSPNPYDALSYALSEISQVSVSAPENRNVVFFSASQTYGGSSQEDKRIRSAILDELVPKFKDKGVRLFTVSLGAGPDNNFMEELAGNTGGLSIHCPQAASLNATAALIYETIKSPDILPEESGRFVVDESIEQLTLVLTKKTPGLVLYLQDPEGYNFNVEKTSAGISWTQFFNFDIVTISAPMPGKWIFMNIDDTNNHIYVSTHLKVRTNMRSSYRQVSQKMKIDAWLAMDDIIIDIGELADTIALTGSITGPDGALETKVDLKAEGIDKKGKDKKVSAQAGGVFYGYFTPKATGTYRLTISVKSKTIERSKSFLLPVIEEGAFQKGQPVNIEKSIDIEKPSKVTPWLNNKYVTQSASALNRALIWFVAINIVLFLSILLYIKRDNLPKVKLSEIRLPKIKLSEIRLPKVKLPDMKLFTKYFRKSKETHDQD
ncbi:MAG: VWA domain-containing protein [Nitrospirae bacterium]|nr:VWA domain-containing protein [Nitrospirota bacterium]